MAYGNNPWRIEETGLLEKHGVAETIFSQGNGYLGIRGSFEEGTYAAIKGHVEGTYLNGFYESAVIRYPEIVCGLPEKNETMLNVTAAKEIAIFCDGKRLLAQPDCVGEMCRSLDLCTGIVARSYTWSSGNTVVQYRSKRLVSFKRVNICAEQITLVPQSGAIELEIKSILDGAVRNQECTDDPRIGSGLCNEVLTIDDLSVKGGHAYIVQSTQNSGMTLACATATVVEGAAGVLHAVANGTRAENRAAFRAECQKPVTITKYIAYQDTRYCPKERLVQAVSELCEQAGYAGFDCLCAEQETYLSDFWAGCDLSVQGEDIVSQGLRYNLFSLLQAVGKDGICSIGAKGLTGEGYEGHYFWDTEAYILPVFVYIRPDIARNLIRYRHDILDSAKECACACGCERGVLFPWRTIDGPECSTYFMAGTAQYHINADVALAVFRYYNATRDDDFLMEYGAELLFQTAQFWMEIGFFSEEKDGRFCINCATGPDEYTVMTNNNCYTNAMAAFNLQYAAWVYAYLQVNKLVEMAALCKRLGLKTKEVSGWRNAAENMYLPYDEKEDLFLQDDEFYARKPWDFGHVPKENYPLLLHYHPLFIYRHRVCKQADTLLAMLQLPANFTMHQKDVAYRVYDELTTHDSSLSKSIFGIIAAEIGKTQDAYGFFMDTVRDDLDDMHGNTADGLHIANMAGSWLGLVQGFGGMREQAGTLAFAPVIPQQWQGYTFRLQYCDCLFEVSVEQDGVTYRWLGGEAVQLLHRGERFVIGPDTAQFHRA